MSENEENRLLEPSQVGEAPKSGWSNNEGKDPKGFQELALHQAAQISNEAPAEGREELKDPTVREYVASLLTGAHKEMFEASSTLDDAKRLIRQQVMNEESTLVLYDGLLAKGSNMSEEKRKIYENQIINAVTNIGNLASALFILDKPNVAKLMTAAKNNSNS